MTDLRGTPAALRAAETLLEVLRLLNATDIDDDGNPIRNHTVRLAAAGPDTAWQATDTALRRVLAAIITDQPHPPADITAFIGEVIHHCHDNGESIAYNLTAARDLTDD